MYNPTFPTTRGAFDKKFYGLTTLGEKGQVVVPIGARKAMNIKKGEKLIVFGRHGAVLVLIKASQFKKFTAFLEKHLFSINKVIRRFK